MNINYQIQILNSSLAVVAEVVTPYPLDKQGTIIEFSKELSDFGQCRFRVSAFDDMLTQYGDILVPHQYHVRLQRNGKTVWQGAIIENSHRNSQFIEVVAAEYLWYLGKKLIHRTSSDINGTTNIFRIFNSGGIDTAVTAIMNETIADYGANSLMHSLTLGTIENPNFPPNITDNNGLPLTGGWTFSSTLTLTYDFQSVLYVLKSLGIYSYADFYIDNSLVFNFKKFVGNDRHYDVNFTFAQNAAANQTNSNIVDYNLPRLGQRMTNKLIGIATNTAGVILHAEQSDENSITTYGLMEGVASYADVKDKGILDARTTAELPLISTPDETNVVVVLNETSAYPIGIWDIGDIVTMTIQNKGVDFTDTRRVVGCSVRVNSTGRELTTVQTNKPLPFQFGSSTAATG